MHDSIHIFVRNLIMEDFKKAINYVAHPDLIDSRVDFLCGAIGKTHNEVCDEVYLKKNWNSGEQTGLPQRKLISGEEDDYDVEPDQLLFVSIGPELKVTEADLINEVHEDLSCLYDHPPKSVVKNIVIGDEKITVEINPNFNEVPIEVGQNPRDCRALHREYVGSIRATKTIQLGVSSVKEAFDHGPDKSKQTYFLDKKGNPPKTPK